jgi:hypothetical protein
VGLGKPLAIDHEPNHHLLAVRALVVRIPALGLGIERALALEVGRRQIVEIERVVEIEQAVLAGGQRALDRLPLGMQPIEIAIQRLIAERAEVFPQNVRQGRPPNPVRHGVLRGWTDQPVQRHHLGQHSRPRAQTRLRQNPVEREAAPHPVAHMNGSGFARLLHPYAVRIHADVVVGCRHPST